MVVSTLGSNSSDLFRLWFGRSEIEAALMDSPFQIASGMTCNDWIGVPRCRFQSLTSRSAEAGYRLRRIKRDPLRTLLKRLGGPSGETSAEFTMVRGHMPDKISSLSSRMPSEKAPSCYMGVWPRGTFEMIPWGFARFASAVIHTSTSPSSTRGCCDRRRKVKTRHPWQSTQTSRDRRTAAQLWPVWRPCPLNAKVLGKSPVTAGIKPGDVLAGIRVWRPVSLSVFSSVGRSRSWAALALCLNEFHLAMLS